MEELKNLGLKTDKITHHGYHRFYAFHLNDIRNEKFTMLEIGVHQGESLKMWKKFFPQVNIYGMDIMNMGSIDGIEIFQADQSKIEDLKKFEKYVIDNNIKDLKLIIDDGSHNPEHQCQTFNCYFSILQEGGTYIIEDIETSYWTKHHCYGYETRYGYKHEKSIVERFKMLTDYINKFCLNSDNQKIIEENTKWMSKEVINMISTITFCKNCIIIKKKSQEDYNYDSLYPYHFNHCL